MPELDGVQATKQIRALPSPKSATPIFALTAHARSGAREQYLEAGMNDYISKPINPVVLFTKLKDLAATLELEGAGKGAPSGEASPASASAIDTACLGTLEAMMPPEDVREFLELYLSQADERLSRIRALSSTGEFGE